MITVIIHKVTRKVFKRKTQFTFEVRGTNHRQLVHSGDTYNNLSDAAFSAGLVTGLPVKPELGPQHFTRI
jgi:hypothetical protein